MTVTNGPNIAPGEAAPDTPVVTAADDALANDELYKAFQARESTTDSPSGEGATGGDEEVAPSDSPPETPSEDDDGDSGDDAPAEEVVDTPVGGTAESFTLLDRTFNHDEAANAIRVVDWANGLAPENVQAIDAVLSGEYVLVPRAEHEANVSGGVGRPTSPEFPTFDDDDDLDPAIKARFDAMNSTIQSLTSQQQQVLARQQQENHSQVLAQVSTGASKFSTSHGLSEDESRSLQERVVSMQILPGYAATYNNDVATAMEKAMEAVYWSDDTYRQRELDKRMSSERETRKVETVKQRKAGSVTGTGGSVARVEPAPTKDDRRSAMVKEVADAMNGGQRA